MKVVFAPVADGNPYQKLLSESLKKCHIDVYKSSIFPKLSWLCKHHKDVEIIHIHWPSSLYRMGRLTFLRSMILVFRILAAKTLGFRLVWTVHNILPHESRTPFWDLFFRYFFIRFGDGIICHCEFALSEIQRRFGNAKKTAVIPHGNYIGCYPNKPSREVARNKLGLPHEGIVFLSFGLLREYKNITELVHQLARLDRDVTLVVAGRGEVDSSLLETEQIGKVGLKFFNDYIPNAEVPFFFAAADIMLAPYRNILTSGAVILSLSMGTPVIAPALGCLPELMVNGGGILYDPSKSGALRRAIEKSFYCNLEEMSQTAESIADLLGWDRLGASTAKFYKDIVDL
ncbi:glycosyltransferase [Desulfuromonas thiophila]|uniref:glycosyltransferase n=1 Tax=Desulfuromonas thiophila TaxID=57664 RepID=UPI00115FBCA3|nr:glycosyltransferase [Desulfuromonas thiophila]